MKNGISIIDEEVQTLDYYVNKLPLFLQNSYGFIEMLESMFKPIKQDFATMEELLYSYDIFDDDFLNFIVELEGSGSSESEPYGDVSEILDRFAAYFGLRRIMNVTYDGETYELNLNNAELLTLIRAQVIRNNYDGTAERAEKFYNTLGFGSILRAVTTGPASAKIYLFHEQAEIEITDNLKHLFFAGYLTIASVGITYTYKLFEMANLIHFTMLGHAVEGFENSTFDEWFRSSKNTTGIMYNLQGEYISVGADYIYKQGSTQELKPSDIIEDSAVYIAY